MNGLKGTMKTLIGGASVVSYRGAVTCCVIGAACPCPHGICPAGSFVVKRITQKQDPCVVGGFRQLEVEALAATNTFTPLLKILATDRATVRCVTLLPVVMN